MDTICLREGEEYIKLCQAMKKAGLVFSGADATSIIISGEVSVNGEVEIRRGRKLYTGDSFSFRNQQVRVET